MGFELVKDDLYNRCNEIDCSLIHEKCNVCAQVQGVNLCAQCAFGYHPENTGCIANPCNSNCAECDILRRCARCEEPYEVDGGLCVLPN